MHTCTHTHAHMHTCTPAHMHTCTQGMMERVGMYIIHQNFCDGEDLARGRPGEVIIDCCMERVIIGVLVIIDCYGLQKFKVYSTSDMY